ncbi:MAG: tRNA (adenine-N1)-methyltransferase [Anaerolineae bacterium]|nr:tRNA (adenine-N1)-methyltransferase [Anaerolineae bacterium]MDW8101626.1 tRNA (adenine-N1)-methyltransferase [Anaerolineae bacterium]
MEVAREGSLVLLISQKGKRFILKLSPGKRFETQFGYIKHEDLIGKPFGSSVQSHLGHKFLLLEPSTFDLIQSIPRITQIIYPKDAGYIILRLNLMPGKRVVEAGTGSGALTLVLARAVMPSGRVYSYEVRPEMLKFAHRTLEMAGVLDYVELKERDIAQGFDEKEVDALFLDLRTPWEYLAQAEETLKPGGFFGALVPTANQVIKLLEGLENHGFVDVEVEELFLRPYKAVHERLRPDDRMVAHTGYLIFARKAEAAGKEWFSFRRGRAWRFHKEESFND